MIMVPLHLTTSPRLVDPGERLLVEKALHAVLLGDRLEHCHQQLLMGDIGPLEHRRDLELAGRDFVVPVLAGMPSLKSSRSERDHLRQVVVAEQLEDALGVGAHRLLAAQQWCLVIQRLTRH